MNKRIYNIGAHDISTSFKSDYYDIIAKLLGIISKDEYDSLSFEEKEQYKKSLFRDRKIDDILDESK